MTQDVTANNSMWLILHKVFSLLNRRERWELLWLSLAVILMAILEVVGVASIMPFMAVVGNPAIVQRNQWLNWVYTTGGFSSTDNFLIFLGFSVLVVIVATNLVKIAAIWIEMSFTNYLGCNLSKRIFDGYLNQPYVYYLDRNTSLMEVILLQEISAFTNHLLQPLTHIFASAIVIFSLFLMLIFFEPLLTFLIIFTLGFAYSALFYVIKKSTMRYGELRFESNAKRSKIASEALGGIKELHVLGRVKFFFEEFSHHAREMARGAVFNQTIQYIPRYFMEIISFGGIIVILIYFLMVKGELGEVLPFLALYAFAGYRLMPRMQVIFAALTSVRFYLPVLHSLYEAQKENRKISRTPVNSPASSKSMRFSKQIKMSKVNFAYPSSPEPVLKDFNLTIKKKARIGFVGASGSGKTTVVDILLGLLVPQQGQVLIDQVPLSIANARAWQRNLGYVPQNIFLSDNTLANNIAFGIPPEKVDRAAVERAARLANLHEFVLKELPQGYDTTIGEKGVRLSGGQRQRIGIARALYHDPEVLIMDEATSALDGITEGVVMQAIQSLAGEKTIITVAHRLTTLQDCDVIYIMEKGRIVEQGTYSVLSESSARFQAMARTTSQSFVS